MGSLRGGALGVGLAIGMTSTAALARGVPPIALEETPVLAAAQETLASSLGEAPPAAPPPLPTSAPPDKPVAKVAPSLPWSLRPPAVASVVRLDTALGVFRDGAAVAPTLLGMMKVADDVGLLFRIGTAHVVTEVQQTAVGDTVLGFYATPRFAAGWRMPFFVGATLPFGSGGGDVEPSPNVVITSKDVPVGYKALAAAASARGAMDNMLFAVNYVAVAAGMGVAYAAPNGFSVQMETTVFALAKIWGGAYEPDTTKFNFTTGVHIGHTIGPVNLSVEMRYQRWLSTPAAVQKDDAKRDNLTVGVGVRTRIVVVPDELVVRPGIAYFEPLDDPLEAAAYHMVVFDVPFVF